MGKLFGTAQQGCTQAVIMDEGMDIQRIQLGFFEVHLEKTLYGIGPESNLYYTLQETLKTVQQSMKSINGVMRKIDDKPNVLIMGE